jgi:hypothetical protein
MKTLNYLQTVITIILITSSVAQAQITIGAKVGLNGSTQSEIGQLYDNNDFKIDGQAGLQLDYRFHSVFSLQLEGNYITKGTKISMEGINDGKNFNRTFEYINVPLLLKARFDDQLGLDKKYRVFFYAGPYYSALLSASDNSETTNIKNEAEDYDMGVSFGGGATYVLNTRNELFIDLRYDMGLSEVLSTDNSLRNKTIGLSIGYRFF